MQGPRTTRAAITKKGMRHNFLPNCQDDARPQALIDQCIKATMDVCRSSSSSIE